MCPPRRRIALSSSNSFARLPTPNGVCAASRAWRPASSPPSTTPADPYRGRYVPAQAPPPIDASSSTTGRIGFRVSGHPAPPIGLSKVGGQSRAREGAGPRASARSRRQRASSHRPRGRIKRVGKSPVAHFLVAHAPRKPPLHGPFPLHSRPSPTKHNPTNPIPSNSCANNNSPSLADRGCGSIHRPARSAGRRSR